MALIDTSIYQNAPRSILSYGLQGYDQAMQDKTQRLQQQGLLAKQQADQLQYQQQAADAKRQQAFRAAMDEVMKMGGDFNTPEGQKTILSHLQSKGFGPEAIELSQHLPKPPPNAYDFQDTPGGLVAGNKQTGEMKLVPGIPSAKQEEKQAEDLFETMKPTLDKFMTPSDPKKGWDPLSGEKGRALQRAIAYMPAKVLKSKAAQDWINNNAKEQQQTVFNPMGMDMANSRKLGFYVNKFDHAQEQYEKKATPLQNLLGTMNSPTWGTAAGDVSLINQLSLAEFGGYKPSEAEYKAFGRGFTPAQYAQKWLSLAQDGAVLPKQVRENMVKEVEEVSRKTHENFKKTMDEQRKRVIASGLNPEEVIYPGGTFQDLEGYFSKKGAPESAPAAATKPHPQDSEAVQWAKAHPNDPRSAAILKANGIQ